MVKAASASNKFCRSSDLANEASVESFFVLRLLTDLGYSDHEIKTKRAIQELKVPKGRQKELYKPDFLLVCRKKPRWLIDAKGTDERVEDYTYQCAGYALQINRKYKDRPVRYYMLTNALLTRVYQWDQEEAILSLRFKDFTDDNPKYQTMRRLLGAEAARSGWATAEQAADGHLLARPPMDVVKKAFLRCHRIIWKAEKKGKQGAFVEFAKLLFVKLWEDRRLRDNPAMLELIGKGEPLPASEVRFSTRWIADQESNDPDPINALLFRQLVDFLEQEITQRKRKRIFEHSERLNLSPGTAKRVVEVLQNYYLFGIDEDLNGRMFEAFLAATMRGQDLGQYFTPRSVVKMITRLADLKAARGPNGIERVLDACCGTGGFLIEALTEMRRQVWDNKSLTAKERTALLEEVANEAIYGIDAGSDPAIARIARINMYLHGDGGSRVYMTDALRHPPQPSVADSAEVKAEVKELRTAFEDGLQFDAVLTNPPFSMNYSATVPEEKEVLDTYDLATFGGIQRRSLRSSVMFIERYWDLLKPGGRLLTVIDDSVLSNKNFATVRDFVRDRFIIRAVVSLHGDAFQRAGARAKTSILYLIKRRAESLEAQPAAFVFESRYIGLDDVVPKTPPSVAEKARAQAQEEMNEIANAFTAYMRGAKAAWLVPAESLDGRLDAKHLRPWSVAQLEPRWTEVGATSAALEDLVDHIDLTTKIDPNKSYRFIRVTYSGRCERGEQRLGREITYSKIATAMANDIVISGMGAVYKAICVVPEGMEDLLISHEFTILRRKPGVKADPMYIWSVLRTSAVVAEWLSSASGLARHRVEWELLRKQSVPLLPYPQQCEIGNLHREALQHEAAIARCTDAAAKALAGLDLEGEMALDKLARAKPPK